MRRRPDPRQRSADARARHRYLRRLLERDRALRGTRGVATSTLEPGDVVEAVVDFAEMDAAKVRPVVVVRVHGDGTVEGHPITSRTRRFGDPRYRVIADPAAAGLVVASAVCVNRLDRLDAASVLAPLGSLVDRDRAALGLGAAAGVAA
jgi:hypothetical protein